MPWAAAKNEKEEREGEQADVRKGWRLQRQPCGEVRYGVSPSFVVERRAIGVAGGRKKDWTDRLKE